jgi:hypothetical protein
MMPSAAHMAQAARASIRDESKRKAAPYEGGRDDQAEA